MVHLAYLMLLFPLAGFLFLVAFGKRIGDPAAGWVGTVAVGGAFVVACIVFAGLLGLPSDHRLVVHDYFTWFSAGGLTVPVGTLVDPLSMTMCLFVTGVSMLIHLYSIGYMKSD
ncbi:MAG TPA: NADH-quinone oxidoreductase subunit L, partial [Acidimicrobiales bacterium]